MLTPLGQSMSRGGHRERAKIPLRARVSPHLSAAHDRGYHHEVDLEVHAGSWPEAVLHVLAHVEAPGVPASLHSPWYVRFAEAALGPASQRTLAEDAQVLARLAGDHHTLSQLQQVAWSSSELTDTARELLRCAALLEADAIWRLPPPGCDLASLEVALQGLIACAPALAEARITLLRPMTTHGRVRKNAIWLGVPGHGVTQEHVIMQAAHEATVTEVAKVSALPEREVEAVALVLLASRCASGHAELHRAWRATWQVRAEHLDADRLPRAARVVLDARLQS